MQLTSPCPCNNHLRHPPHLPCQLTLFLERSHLHITVGILSAAFPETHVTLEINPSTFVMIETDADIDAMHITTNPEFQPYLMQALATFQADKVSKDKGKQCMKFNSVHIPPHKKPENCTTTISEELFSPEIQKSTKEAAPTSSWTSVPPPQRSIQAPPVTGPSGSGSIKDKPTSTATPALPHTPPTSAKHCFSHRMSQCYSNVTTCYSMTCHIITVHHMATATHTTVLQVWQRQHLKKSHFSLVLLYSENVYL